MIFNFSLAAFCSAIGLISLIFRLDQKRYKRLESSGYSGKHFASFAVRFKKSDTKIIFFAVFVATYLGSYFQKNKSGEENSSPLFRFNLTLNLVLKRRQTRYGNIGRCSPLQRIKILRRNACRFGDIPCAFRRSENCRIGFAVVIVIAGLRFIAA